MTAVKMSFKPKRVQGNHMTYQELNASIIYYVKRPIHDKSQPHTTPSFVMMMVFISIWYVNITALSSLIVQYTQANVTKNYNLI